jgi:prepilin peptidase CpaA
MKLDDIAAVAVALVACIFDLHHRRIPNALTFGAALAAFITAAIVRGPSGFGASAGGWVVGLAIWLPLYALGGIGAGDVKLMAAIGAWLGVVGGLHAALYAGVAGGVLALAVVIAKGCLRQTLSNVQLLVLHWRIAGFAPHAQLTLDTSTSPRLAYALPVLIGTVAAIWLR